MKSSVIDNSLKIDFLKREASDNVQSVRIHNERNKNDNLHYQKTYTNDLLNQSPTHKKSSFHNLDDNKSHKSTNIGITKQKSNVAFSHPLIQEEREKIRDLQYEIAKISEIQKPYANTLSIKKDMVPGMINEIKGSVMSMLLEQDTISKNIKGYKPDFNLPNNFHHFDPRIDLILKDEKN